MQYFKIFFFVFIILIVSNCSSSDGNDATVFENTENHTDDSNSQVATDDTIGSHMQRNRLGYFKLGSTNLN